MTRLRVDVLGALRVQQAMQAYLRPAERNQSATAAATTLAKARAMERAGLVAPCRTVVLLEKAARVLGGRAGGKAIRESAYRADGDKVDGEAGLVNFAILVYGFIAAGVVFGMD